MEGVASAGTGSRAVTAATRHGKNPSTAAPGNKSTAGLPADTAAPPTGGSGYEGSGLIGWACRAMGFTAEPAADIPEVTFGSWVPENESSSAGTAAQINHSGTAHVIPKLPHPAPAQDTESGSLRDADANEPHDNAGGDTKTPAATKTQDRRWLPYQRDCAQYAYQQTKSGITKAHAGVQFGITKTHAGVQQGLASTKSFISGLSLGNTAKGSTGAGKSTSRFDLSGNKDHPAFLSKFAADTLSQYLPLNHEQLEKFVNVVTNFPEKIPTDEKIRHIFDHAQKSGSTELKSTVEQAMGELKAQGQDGKIFAANEIKDLKKSLIKGSLISLSFLTVIGVLLIVLDRMMAANQEKKSFEQGLLAAQKDGVFGSVVKPPNATAQPASAS